MTFTPDYITFRHIGDGMNLLMALYSLLSFFKNKNLTFLLYCITLFSGSVEYYAIDKFHLQGQTDIVTSSFAPEMTCINVILYCVFMKYTFNEHIQNKFFFTIIFVIIKILLLTIIINLILKNNNLEYFSLWVYGIVILTCTGLFGIIFKVLYELTFSFMKYYLIGSIFITMGWILKCTFQTFPEYFHFIITFQRDNAFTFPNTYGQLGAIFESIFIFIAISESHKLLELSKIDLRKKILLSVEDKNSEDKVVLEIKQRFLITVITTFSKKLTQSLEVVENTLRLLSMGNNSMAKTKLMLIHKISSESIQIIRSIVREFNKQNQLILNKSIESKAYEISKYHLTQKHLTFTLYVNNSEEWRNISDELEEQMLLFYENLLKIFIKYKEFLHLMITLSMNGNGDLFLIVQDDGCKVSSKTKMIRDLNLILTYIKKWQGEIYYSIEDHEESTVRVHFITKI